MAGSVNKFIGIGNCVADAEVRQVGNGGSVMNLRIAMSESWKDGSGERKEKTTFLNVTTFNERLINAISQYLTKGTKVYVEGKLQLGKYTDKNGQERDKVEVVVGPFGGAIELLSTRQGGEQEDRPARSAGRRAPAEDDMDDQIPF